MSYDALQKGFVEGCRRVFAVDGCHLKSISGRILLSAVAMDANNIFPLTICICQSENRKNYCWFFGFMKEHMGFIGWNGIDYYVR